MTGARSYLPAIAALAATLPPGVRFDGQGGRDPRPKPPPDEAARARQREGRVARMARRYERWLRSGGRPA